MQSQRTRSQNAKSGVQALQPLNIRGIANLKNTKVDTVLASILTQVEGKIRLEIDQDNTIVSLVQQNGDKRFGSIAEIERLNGFRKFTNDAKKASIAAEIIDPVRMLCFDAIKVEDINEPTVINQGALASLKEFKLQLDYLEENIEFSEDTFRRLASESIATDLCDILNDWMGKIIVSIRTTIAMIVRGEDTKGFVSESLFGKSVPKWAYDKLAKGSLAKLGLVSVETVFFPRDPRKGIYFTVKELASDAFARNHTWLLRNSQYQRWVLTNTDLLKEACNAKENISFTSESDPVGTALRNEKVYLSRVAYDKDVFLNDRATKINLLGNASFASPKLAFVTLMNLGLAYQTGHFKTSDIARDFYAKLYPDVDFTSEGARKKGPASIILEGGNVSPMDEVFQWNAAWKQLFLAIAPAMMGVAHNSPLMERLNQGYEHFAPIPAATEAAPATLAVKNKEGTITAPAKAEVVAEPGYSRPTKSEYEFSDFHDVTPIETAADRTLAKSMFAKMKIDDVSLQKTGKVNRAPGLTDLGQTGAKTVKLFRDDPKLAFLADPVKDWLRGFSTKRIQAVAAKFVSAQFHEITGLDDDDDNPDADAPDDDDGDDDFD